MFYVLALAVTLSPGLAKANQASCEKMWIPVNLPGLTIQPPWAGNFIHLEVCHPRNQRSWPTKTIVMVHGSGADLGEYDAAIMPERYSFIENVARVGGYATVAMDRPGSGLSTYPPSNQMTIDVVVSAVAQVFDRVRNGTLTSGAIFQDNDPSIVHDNMPPMSTIIYYGKSLATGYGWRLAKNYPSAADGFILNGGAHDTPLYWVANIVGPHFGYPMAQDPTVQFKISEVSGAVLTGAGSALSSLDYDPNAPNPFNPAKPGMGYIGFEPFNANNPDPNAPYGWFAQAFIYAPGTAVQVLQHAEVRKSAVSSYLLAQSAVEHAFAGVHQPCAAGANVSDSCYVTKPTMFVMGDHDGAVCGSPSFGTLWKTDGTGQPGPGIDCSGTAAQASANWHTAEDAFYTNVPGGVYLVVAKAAGHDFHEADSFRPSTFPTMMSWLSANGL
jgi:pimeloyl-ACP methyl ester carboxylesterase